MSNNPEFELDKAHHWFGVEFNNAIFPLLEKADRTAEETELMIQMAYASTLHWSKFSKHKPANMARSHALNGELEIARKYYEDCRKSFEEISDPEDKKISESDLNSGPWYGLE